ncbi:MAG: response regulator [Parvibaculales bacterium]
MQGGLPITKPIDEDTPHILIIDDDMRIRDLLKEYLHAEGFRVSGAANAEAARNLMKTLRFDLLVLDVMMPGESGLDLTKSLREISNNVPIILLTAKRRTEERIEGFDMGADDYLPKPFEPKELLMRIQAILRRAQIETGRPIADNVYFGDCTYSTKNNLLSKNNKTVPLTTRERAILHILALHGGEVVSRARLIEEDNTSRRSIDVHITRLRRKIENNPKEPVLLQTIRQKGYILHIKEK